MDLSIIIVSWNVQEKLRANLSALFKSSGNFTFEVYVIDNNSKDGSVEMIRKEFPQVHLISNSKNCGFARANNQALKLASGKFILLLNPDMLLFPDTLEKSLNWAQQNKQATVSTCQLIDRQGQTIRQVRRFPQLRDQLLIVLKIPHLIPAVLNRYLNFNFNYKLAAEVDSVRGAFFLINRLNYQKISGLNTPLLDERYFIWFEEVDFCRQVYKLGGEVWYQSDAKCQDYIGASFSQVNRKQTQKYFSDSMLKYFHKWEKPWKCLVLKITWFLVKIFV
jgi:GT2 family glycosyltransferase